MKKNKTINKLLSSLTLISVLTGIGFNSQYQKTQNIITESSNNSLNKYIKSNAEPVQMGDIWVTVDDSDLTIITGYSSGTGELKIADYITQIADNAFKSNQDITSLNLTDASNLKAINNESFASCSNLSGNIIFPSNLETLGLYSFNFSSKINGLDFSKSTKLIEIQTAAFQHCSNLAGDLVIPSSVRSIGNGAFGNSKIDSLDLSQATSLTTISDDVFSGCTNLTGNLVIPSSVTSIGLRAFAFTSISSLDLSQATNLTTIGDFAFLNCSNLDGDLIIQKNITKIGDNAYTGVNFDNIYFLSESSPTFGSSWQPTVTGKIYVPSEQAKQAYLDASNFGFTEDQIEIGLPPEPTPKKSYLSLILGLLIGFGIPIVLAIIFIIWCFVKKKKTTVKI